MRCRHDHRALADSARPLINLALIHNGGFVAGADENSPPLSHPQYKVAEQATPKSTTLEGATHVPQPIRQESNPQIGFRSDQPLPREYDALEDRLAMSLCGGVAGGIVHVPTPIVFLPPATAVNLTVEPRDVVMGSLGASETSQYYSFQLQQGDYLQSDVSVRATGTVACQMSILNSSGTVLDTSAPNGFRAPASGTYYAEVTGSVSGLLASGSYQLELHRLALAQGTQSVATLAETGSMYAFLNGNTLDITGPTGYGFGITGNWTETTATNLFTGQVAATYTATGTLELQSAAGSIALDIAAGQVAMVSTAAQVNGQVFGVISGLNMPVTLNTGPIVATVASGIWLQPERA